MRFEVVKTVFLKELREMLRDRRSLVVMFGLPLLLYPLLAIGITGMGLKRQKELREQPARVFLEHADAAPRLRELIGQKESGLELETAAPSDPDAELRAGKLDAVLHVPLLAEQRALAGEDVEIRLQLNRSRTEAKFVEDKVRKTISDYERWLIEQRLQRLGVPATVLKPLKTETDDVATSDQRFGKVLAAALPVILLMTGMLGALFPALNATTTERELGTLETLLVTPVGRTELLVAKGSLVLLCGLLTAGLNMLSMALVLLRSVSLASQGTESLRISVGALSLAFLAAVPAIIFFSALVLIAGLLARNFREANSFATPCMLVPMAAMAVGFMEPPLSAGLLVTPVVSTTLIIREVMTAHVSVRAFVLAFVSSCVYAGLMLSLAGRLFSSEQLVNPAWEPISMKGLRRATARGVRRLPAVDSALTLFAVSLLLLFYVSPSWPVLWSHVDPNADRHKLLVTLFGNELLLILAPALFFAWLARWRWAQTFSWRPTRLGVLGGAALVGIGLAPWINLLSGLQQMFWPRDPESARMEAELMVPALAQHPVLVIVTVGLLAGICEELFYRGPLQTAFLRRLPPWGAIVITALLFAGIHLDLHGMALRALLGMFLGWIVWRSASIFPAMLAHGLYDSTALALAAWTIRRHGAERVMTETSIPSFHLTASDAAQLIAGALLLAAGWYFCRKSLRPGPQDIAAEPHAALAAPPAVAD